VKAISANAIDIIDFLLESIQTLLLDSRRKDIHTNQLFYRPHPITYWQHAPIGTGFDS
jgi:hypothetical protein